MVDLRRGDCLSVMKEIADGAIDLTVTSPPYDDLRTYNGNIDQWSFDKFKEIAKQLYRVTTEGGIVVWIVADATVNGSETGTSFKQAMFFKEIGFNLHDTMIWEKPTFTATGALKTRYAQVFEYMFVFTKGKIKTFNPIKDRRNITAGAKRGGTIRQKDGTFRSISNKGKQTNEYGQRFNIWKNDTVLGKERCGHPAQFPIQLATDHIISWSNENDTVLDCFMGSGTSGIACVNTKRNFIGIELDGTYFKIAKKRIEEAEKAVLV